MRNMVDRFGLNAGKVWETLNKHGPLTQTELMKKTKLTKEEFFTAIGWLARENKVREENSTFMLGETNLTSRVGETAGKVWSVLETVREIDMEYIPKLTGVSEEEFFAAVGWLARENKIKTKKAKPRKPRLKIELTE